jgi:hypothetical protein
MTKTLRITSIVVAAAAVVLIVMPMVFSSGMDEQAANLLNLPGVLESLSSSAAAPDTGAVPPLVKQAEKFAAYRNPPPPPKREISTPNRERPAVRPAAAVTAKFELLGTSYYSQRPELSLALIDEPGAGLRWVRQSSKIGHLVVEQIKDGKVVIRDGADTYELEAKRTPKRSLVKGESTYSTQAPSSGLFHTESLQMPDDFPTKPKRTVSSQRSRPPSNRISTSSIRDRTTPAAAPSNTADSHNLSDEQIALFDQFAREANEINDPNIWAAKADELMKHLSETSQVTDEEAELLDELGQKLQDANEQGASED